MLMRMVNFLNSISKDKRRPEIAVVVGCRRRHEEEIKTTI